MLFRYAASRGPTIVKGEMTLEDVSQPHHDGHVYGVSGDQSYLQANEERQIREPLDPAAIVCQFCGKSFRQVPRLFEAKRRVRDPSTSAIVAVWICNECIGRMTQIMAKEPPGTRTIWEWQAWSPGEPMDG
jgi:hypothetical protein